MLLPVALVGGARDLLLPKGVLRRLTERRAHEGYLNVCIFVQELNEPLEAVQGVLHNFRNKDHYPVLLRFSLLLQIV